jgi:hypothetical protein
VFPFDSNEINNTCQASAQILDYYEDECDIASMERNSNLDNQTVINKTKVVEENIKFNCHQN